MNILLTTVSLDSRTGGGTAERTRRLALHLARQGHTCAIASMRGGDIAEELTACGMTVHVTGAISLRFQFPLIRPVVLSRLVQNADAIHVLGYWNLLSFAATVLATRTRVPYALSAAGEFVGLERPRPVARIFHFFFGRRMIRNAGSLIAITPLEKDQIIRRFGLADERVLVLPNGIEEAPPAIANGSLNNRLPESAYVLFVGRLAEVKGPDLLLRAFADIAQEYPGVSLVIGGPDFGMEQQLRAMAEAKGVTERVFFTGHLDERGKREAYRRAMFLAVPSRSEAMSLVALEAGIEEIPVLLTDQCGFDSVAEIGGGKVVSADVDGLRQGLQDLLSQREELAVMGRKLATYVRKEFTWPKIVRRLVEHFETIRTGEPQTPECSCSSRSQGHRARAAEASTPSGLRRP